MLPQFQTLHGGVAPPSRGTGTETPEKKKKQPQLAFTGGPERRTKRRSRMEPNWKTEPRVHCIGPRKPLRFALWGEGRVDSRLARQPGSERSLAAAAHRGMGHLHSQPLPALFLGWLSSRAAWIQGPGLFLFSSWRGAGGRPLRSSHQRRLEFQQNGRRLYTSTCRGKGYSGLGFLFFLFIFYLFFSPATTPPCQEK